MMEIASETRLLNVLRKLSTLSLMQLPDGIELSRPAVTLMTWVSTFPGCGVVDIAEGLQLSPPTISVGIRRLVKGGWIERRQNLVDRRARPIFLTPKGEIFMAHLQTHQANRFKIFLSGLSPSEQELLMDLLEQALDSLTNYSVESLRESSASDD